MLRWDGAPLGLKNAGSQSWRVPALDEFAVTQAEAVQVNDQRQIQVHFSDALDTRQDLKGLVRLSQGEFTTGIQNNLLTLYVNEDVVGKVTLTLEAGDAQPRSVSRSIGDARVQARVHEHQAAGALRRQGRDPAGRQDALACPSRR